MQSLRVLLTGQKSTNLKAAEAVVEKGGEAILFPLQEFALLENDLRTDKLAGKTLIFTSPLAVDFFFQQIPQKCWELTIAVGDATAEALKKKNCSVDYWPKEDYSVEGLISLLKDLPLQKESYFLPCSQLAKESLEHFLQSYSTAVERCDLYGPVTLSKKALPEFEGVCFFSPSAVELFIEFYSLSGLVGKQISCIGESTASALSKAGCKGFQIAEKNSARETALQLFL